ncbi:hypothetical protein GE09DRAFT_1074235 [Coniochaeta sp. 2T2.1]|nr:hypothetical protein GE09DRAFT_1074235 [Coniochaeta sp. 2T2.1]
MEDSTTEADDGEESAYSGTDEDHDDDDEEEPADLSEDDEEDDDDLSSAGKEADSESSDISTSGPLDEIDFDQYFAPRLSIYCQKCFWEDCKQYFHARYRAEQKGRPYPRLLDLARALNIPIPEPMLPDACEEEEQVSERVADVRAERLANQVLKPVLEYWGGGRRKRGGSAPLRAGTSSRTSLLSGQDKVITAGITSSSFHAAARGASEFIGRLADATATCQRCFCERSSRAIL